VVTGPLGGDENGASGLYPGRRKGWVTASRSLRNPSAMRPQEDALQSLLDEREGDRVDHQHQVVAVVVLDDQLVDILQVGAGRA
jgi:hypothetical protein